MPGRLPAEVREKAREVGKRLDLQPWWEHREAVLAVVYRELGITPPVQGHRRGPPGSRKRRRENASGDAGASNQRCAECPVCLEPRRLGVMAPCGHRVCDACFPRCRSTCPVCRATVQMFVARTYE